MVGALEETGALEEVAEGIASVTGGDRTAELLGILWASAIGSGVVDNIPFTAAMIPVVDDARRAEDDAYWWALALGACFGGNATIVARGRNVAASGMAARAGVPDRVRARSCAYGIPVTLVSLGARDRVRHGAVRMSPRTISDLVLHEPPLLRDDETRRGRRAAGPRAAGCPRCRSSTSDERFAGIFGEREFMEALFPGYLKQLKDAGFLTPLARRGAREARGLPRSSRSAST